MKRLFRALVVLASLSPLACSAADSAPYKVGTDFQRARAYQEPANPAKIEVMEIFAYSCPHCFQLDPILTKWAAKQRADVEFVRSPNTLGRADNPLRNRAFYAARLLGVVERFHPALFEAVHAQHKPMTTPEELRDLFVRATGGKAAEFEAAFSSFAADAGFRRGEDTARAIGVTAVPTLVVDGKYFVSPAGGGFGRMLKVTDFLVEQARQERAKR